jgi:hypothetical protein
MRKPRLTRKLSKTFGIPGNARLLIPMQGVYYVTDLRTRMLCRLPANIKLP